MTKISIVKDIVCSNISLLSVEGKKGKRTSVTIFFHNAVIRNQRFTPERERERESQRERERERERERDVLHYDLGAVIYRSVYIFDKSRHEWNNQMICRAETEQNAKRRHRRLSRAVPIHWEQGGLIRGHGTICTPLQHRCRYGAFPLLPVVSLAHPRRTRFVRSAAGR